MLFLRGQYVSSGSWDVCAMTPSPLQLWLFLSIKWTVVFDYGRTRGTRAYFPSHLPGNIFGLFPHSRGEEVGLVVSMYEGKGQGAETFPYTHFPSPLQQSSRAPHRSHHGWVHRYVLALPKLIMSLNQTSTRCKAIDYEDFRNNRALHPHVAEAQSKEVSCLRAHS